MVSFVIPALDYLDTGTKKNEKHILGKLKQSVSRTKHLYDKPYGNDRNRFCYVTRQFEYADIFRRVIHMEYNTPNVSNAWLKAYELFTQYKLFPARSNTFVYFDNAAFPGSFILAANHIVGTMCDINKFKWYGSSLISDDNKSDMYGDIYSLRKNYPNNWIMSEDNNGDVTVMQNLENYQKFFGNTVDLYTSDLGFDVSDDYNKQEEVHMRANMGQIITGLLVLRRGGNMVTKQYSYFEPITIGIIGIMTRLFERVEICKPMFSKSGNSETYLVCMGYNGYDRSNIFIQILAERMRSWNFDHLIEMPPMCGGFISAIIESQTYFVKTQIEKIENIISEYNRYISGGKIDRHHIFKTNMFHADMIENIRKWRLSNTVKRLPVLSPYRLSVTEVICARYNNKKKNK